MQLPQAPGDRPARIGGYRTSVLSRPSRRVTMMAVTGQSPVPRLGRLG
jgi:hypothetical protein